MAGFSIEDDKLRRIVLILGFLAIIIAGIHTFSLVKGGLRLLLDVLSPFLVALLVAYLMAPLVAAMQRWLGIWRILGIFLVYLMVAILVLTALAFLVPLIFSQLKSLIESFKAVIPNALEWLSENDVLGITSDTVVFVKERLDALEIDFSGAVNPLIQALKQIASGSVMAAGELTTTMVAALRRFLTLLLFLVFMAVINFYLILDWHRIRPFLEKLVPSRMRRRTFDTVDKIDLTVGGFLRGQLIVAAVVGTSFAVGLFLIGFIGFGTLQRFAVLIGLVAGIGGFVPYLGPMMGLTPALLIIGFSDVEEWTIKIVSLVLVVTLFAAIQAVEGWVLQPKIVGKGAGLHPLAVLLALFIGGQFGIGGLIVAVPAAGVVKVLLLEYVWEPYQRNGDRTQSEE